MFPKIIRLLMTAVAAAVLATTPVKLTVTKLAVGPLDQRLFVIPANFIKSGY